MLIDIVMIVSSHCSLHEKRLLPLLLLLSAVLFRLVGLDAIMYSLFNLFSVLDLPDTTGDADAADEDDEGTRVASMKIFSFHIPSVTSPSRSTNFP